MFCKILDQNSIQIGAPAKINLFLDVLGKRADGFHDIFSLFQAVSLFDRLKISRTENSGCAIRLVNQADLSTGPDNIIAKAWQVLVQEYRPAGGISVELEKNIPLAAGLGGGSSDGAALLAGCNLLYNLGLTRGRLAGLGARVGSDVPFFFSRGQALVSGRGEGVREMELPTDYWLILVTPPFAVSTAEAYAALRRALTESKPDSSLTACRTAKELIATLSARGNDFESLQLISHPEIGLIKEKILSSGARLARLSGSGPTVFGLYDAAPSEELELQLQEWGWQVHTVRPVIFTSWDAM